MNKLARVRALEVMLRWATRRRGETGANNAGWFVEMVQRADSLPGEIYAWCQSAANGAHRLATGGTIKMVKGRFEIVGGKMLLGGTASVGFFLDTARSRGLVVEKPRRADHVCFHSYPGAWPYHVGMIVQVLKFGPVVYLKTAEGNTSYADALVSDPGTGRDAVVVKRRVVKRSLLTFVRIPGLATENWKFK